MSQKVHYFVSMPFYPKNVVQPQCRGRSKMTLNIIFVLIIVTHAQGFESIKKYGGQGPLAAPYWAFSPVPPAECLESLQQHRIDMCSSAAIHNTEKIDKIHLVELSPSIFSKWRLWQFQDGILWKTWQQVSEEYLDQKLEDSMWDKTTKRRTARY